MTDGQAQKQHFFACKVFIAGIARINIKGYKDPDPPRFPRVWVLQWQNFVGPVLVCILYWKNCVSA